MEKVMLGDYEVKVYKPEVFDFVVPEGWEELFYEEYETINRIRKSTRARGKSYPLEREQFTAFYNCPLYKVKVVILGQDPYPGVQYLNGELVPHACGMAFSVKRGIKVPGSLSNIFLCIKKCYPEYQIPNHGDLTKWANQGILLLNTCLSYFPDNPLKGPQKRYWGPFVDKVIETVCRVNPNVIFILWGKEAQKIPLQGKIERLEGIHPSPQNGKQFVETVDHFRVINEKLSKLGIEEIDWSL